MNAELQKFLDATQAENNIAEYQILKQSDFETTALVTLVEPPQTIIEKEIRASQLGSAYEQLAKATADGREFTYLPRVYSVEKTSQLLRVRMEYVEGQTLAAQMAAIPQSVRVAYFSSIYGPLCDAVTELHESFDPTIIHRDIKPENIIVNAQTDRLTLIDFGIARQWREDADKDTVFLGTRSWAPPEQFGFAQTDVRTDIYSLGLTLAYCLCAQDDLTTLRDAKFKDAQIPSDIAPILTKACSLDPDQRYSSVRELKDALTHALQLSAAHAFESKLESAPATVPVHKAVAATATSAPSEHTTYPKCMIDRLPATISVFLATLLYFMAFCCIVSIPSGMIDQNMPALAYLTMALAVAYICVWGAYWLGPTSFYLWLTRKLGVHAPNAMIARTHGAPSIMQLIVRIAISFGIIFVLAAIYAITGNPL